MKPGAQIAQPSNFHNFQVFIYVEKNNSFITKSKSIHGEKYNYSLVSYTNNHTKVKIICSIHNIFEQTPKSHLRGSNCPKCSSYVKSGKNLTKNSFIEKSIEKHGNKYDYSLVNYVNSLNKVKIICPIHGEFLQIPYHHYNGKGCQKCSNNVKTVDDFITKSINHHGLKYDYSNIEYSDTNTKVNIICPIHGVFKQTPKHHYNGSGCPKCKNSKGEKEVINILKECKINFVVQKRFTECRYKFPLPFDFYLPELNTCIEYDGIQHFKPMEIWGGEKEFELIKLRDNIKNKYCLENNLTLIRVSKNDDIRKIINKIIDMKK